MGFNMQYDNTLSHVLLNACSAMRVTEPPAVRMHGQEKALTLDDFSANLAAPQSEPVIPLHELNKKFGVEPAAGIQILRAVPSTEYVTLRSSCDASKEWLLVVGH